MKNQLQPGHAIDIAAPTEGTVSGNGYLFGSLFGVASVTAVAGVIVTFWVEGVYALTKNSTEAWTVGQLVYWDNTNFRCTSSAATGANKLIGVATAAAANPSATGAVRLNAVFIS